MGDLVAPIEAAATAFILQPSPSSYFSPSSSSRCTLLSKVQANTTSTICLKSMGLSFVCSSFRNLFFRFTREDNIGGYSKVKSSEQRRIRKSIGETFPTIEKELDIIFPKKQPLMLAKGYLMHNFLPVMDPVNWLLRIICSIWIIFKRISSSILT